MTVKVTCGHCGDVEVGADEIELRIDPTGMRESYYSFTCPECMCVRKKRATQHAVELLTRGGVEVRDFGPPALKPLTRDDLLDFHLLLDSDDWFEKLENTTPTIHEKPFMRRKNEV